MNRIKLTLLAGIGACAVISLAPIAGGRGAILANGSATHFDQVIPENCFPEGPYQFNVQKCSLELSEEQTN